MENEIIDNKLNIIGNINENSIKDINPKMK